jgi:hypothetical protein
MIFSLNLACQVPITQNLLTNTSFIPSFSFMEKIFILFIELFFLRFNLLLLDLHYFFLIQGSI